MLPSLNIYSTYATPIGLTDSDSYLPSDDPDCQKQHNFRQFNLINVICETMNSSPIHYTTC